MFFYRHLSKSLCSQFTLLTICLSFIFSWTPEFGHWRFIFRLIKSCRHIFGLMRFWTSRIRTNGLNLFLLSLSDFFSELFFSCSEYSQKWRAQTDEHTIQSILMRVVISVRNSKPVQPSVSAVVTYRQVQPSPAFRVCYVRVQSSPGQPWMRGDIGTLLQTSPAFRSVWGCQGELSPFQTNHVFMCWNWKPSPAQFSSPSQLSTTQHRPWQALCARNVSNTARHITAQHIQD